MASRAAAHAQLDVLLDALESADITNDPEARTLADEHAHKVFMALASLVVGSFYAARLGAAMLGLRPDQIGDQRDDLVQLAQSAVTPGRMEHPEERAGLVRALARFGLDFAPLLAPSLGERFAVEMYLVNTGGDAMWLTRPNRLKGMSRAKSQQAIADITLLSHAYYYAGYNNIAVEAAARIRDGVGRSWQALVRTRQKLKLEENCRNWKEQGQRDRLEGRQANPPIAGQYDQEELDRLMRALATGRAV